MSLTASIVQALFAALSMLSRLASLWSQRRQRQAGEDAVIATSLKEQAARVEAVRRARRAVPADRLPEHDPYRRD